MIRRERIWHASAGTEGRFWLPISCCGSSRTGLYSFEEFLLSNFGIRRCRRWWHYGGDPSIKGRAIFPQLRDRSGQFSKRIWERDRQVRSWIGCFWSWIGLWGGWRRWACGRIPFPWQWTRSGWQWRWGSACKVQDTDFDQCNRWFNRWEANPGIHDLWCKWLFIGTVWWVGKF